MKTKKTMSAVIGYAMALCFVACSPVMKNPAALDYRSAQALTPTEKEYVIRIGDQLDLKFFNSPELNESITVRPDGRISLQLAQEIVAAGLTPAQLSGLLKKTYSTELADPQIAVIVRSFSTQKIFIDGEVNKPGLANLTGQLTALQALALAGGLKDSAKPQEVIIIRRTAGQKVVPIVVNLQDAINGTDINQDITLMPYDVVFVPKSSVANVNKWVDQYLRRNIPVPFGIGAGID